jgi:hypothetical protein
VATIEEKNRVLTGQILWKMKPPAIHGLDEVFGKKIAHI